MTGCAALRVSCSTGGLLLSLRTARRQWIRHNDTGGLFFVNTTAQLGLLQPPEPSGSTATPAQQLPALQTPDPASSTQGSAQRSTTVPGAVTPADVEKHKALIAAGLSESEIVSLSAGLAPAEPAPATSSSSTTGSSSSSCGSSNGPAGTLTGLRSPERINAALSSADQEMQAHIAAQSLSAQLERSRSSSRAGSRQGASLGDSSSTSRSGNAVQDGRLSPSKQDLMRFLRDFEAEGFPAEDMLWGLQGEAAVHR
jgi:hypothetical protein